MADVYLQFTADSRHFESTERSLCWQVQVTIHPTNTSIYSQSSS